MIWTKVVVLHGSPKANGWSRFSLSSAHHHLMGIPIFSSAIFRWSSDTSWIINFMNHRKISLLLNIHQQKTWSIPTLTHSTRRFCCFRKKKKRRLRCHVTGRFVSSPGYSTTAHRWGSSAGFPGIRTRWVRASLQTWDCLAYLSIIELYIYNTHIVY